MKIQSDAFQPGGLIPKKYTCDGENISPHLAWSEIPAKAKSLVLIMDDPDAPAGVWDHWIVVNIPSATTGLPENVSKLPSGAFISPNSWNKSTYIGPCPPGGEHRYAFKLYALDTTLNLVPESRKESIEAAMRGHILAETELMGRYQHGSTK